MAVLQRKVSGLLVLSFVCLTSSTSTAAPKRSPLVRGNSPTITSRRLPCYDSCGCDGRKKSKGGGYSPTPRPTPFPTREPTPFPTREPTPFPTREPTPLPVAAAATPEPVTPEPTPFPVTPEPTPFPVTPEPTPFPVTPPPDTTTEEPVASEEGPTPQPTKEPTPAPGSSEEPAAPTREPTSEEPAAPTRGPTSDNGTPYDTVVDDEGNLKSSCKIEPVQSKPLSTKVSFTYEVRVDKGADVEQVLAAVEESTHELLTTDLLDCDFFGGGGRNLQEKVKYTSFESIPKDTAFTPGDDVCQDVADDEDCYFVRGGITANHLPHEPESDVVDQISAILTDSQDTILADAHPNLRSVGFNSFSGKTTAIDDDNDETDGEHNSDSFENNTWASRGAVAAGTVVALAAVAFLAAVVLLVRRKRRDSTATTVQPVDHTKSRTFLLDDDSTDSSSDGFKAVIVNEESDSDSTSPQNLTADTAVEMSYYEKDYSHDPNTCVTPSCQICQEHSMSQNPEFVHIGNTMHLSIADLSPSRIPTDARERSYAVSDTVRL